MSKIIFRDGFVPDFTKPTYKEEVLEDISSKQEFERGLRQFFQGEWQLVREHTTCES